MDQLRFTKKKKKKKKKKEIGPLRPQIYLILSSGPRLFSFETYVIMTFSLLHKSDIDGALIILHIKNIYFYC